MGKAGAVVTMIMLFMAVTSSGKACGTLNPTSMLICMRFLGNG